MDKKYYGIVPPIITPITQKETVDEDGFRQLIDYCIDGGLHGLFVAGSNGECMALTQAERNNAIRIMLDQVNGRIPVMAGVMDSSTRRVIDNIKALEQMGGTCAVVTPIFYARHTSQEETVRHVEQILNETTVDLIIYNIPAFTGQTLTGATIRKLAALDSRVAGYKDTSNNFADFLSLLDDLGRTPFSMFMGASALGMTSLLMGADGFVPALSACFPEMFAAAYEAGKARDFELSMKYDRLIRQTSKLLGMCKNATASAKYAISLRGFTRKEVIMPQDQILPEEEEKIRRAVEEIDAGFAALKAEL